MKRIITLFIFGFFLSCGTKVPFDNSIMSEFKLDSEDKLKKVQFYTSATIVLERTTQSENQQQTDNSGSLITSSSNQKNRIIIQANTKCILESYGPNGELNIRFEDGKDKILTFATRQEPATSSKFFLIADWTNEKGGKLSYGNETFFATQWSKSAYLQVKRKVLQRRSKMKDRQVKGMKV